MDAVQMDLFDNITGQQLEYRDPKHGFWRVGIGVGYEFNKRARVTLVVIKKIGPGKRNVKVPLANVRLKTNDATNEGDTPTPAPEPRRRARR